MRALISVYDKEGVLDLARRLEKLGVEILSTGGTGRLLKEHGVKVLDVSSYTGFEEMMDGRVKSLHPKVHGGILADRDNPEHRRQAKENGVEMIDIVIVNLYPFEETLKAGKSFDQTKEMIDIGGPTLIRAAAKNFKHVLVVVEPKDYVAVLEALESGDIPFKLRQRLASKAFARTAFYDAEIMKFLAEPGKLFPEKMVRTHIKRQDMRYGENPHQQAAFYALSSCEEPCVPSAQQIQGKALSFNNIYDADVALEIVKEFRDPCVAVIKHGNPCGVCNQGEPHEALARAYEADSLSAFGSIIALNTLFTAECASFIADKFVEVVIAQDFSDEARAILAKKKNLRLLRLPDLRQFYDCPECQEFLTAKKVTGGLLMQTRAFPKFTSRDIELVEDTSPSKDAIRGILERYKEEGKMRMFVPTQAKPSEQQLRDMIFAIKVTKHTKSNAIVYVKDECTVGIGAGQMSRVDSSMIATRKAGEKARGAVCCSDAFFPFRDGVDAIAKAGISAIVQPGGSIRDTEVIGAADEHGIAMVFSGLRLFRH